jgi:hypothetical protein
VVAKRARERAARARERAARARRVVRARRVENNIIYLYKIIL